MKLKELNARMHMSRRSFLAGTAGGGLVMGLGVVLPGCSQDAVVTEIADTGVSQSFAPTIWFEIDGDGKILVNITKAEMGQHVGTALARIVAEELGADWNDIAIDHVDSDPRWGFMVTGGSWSVFTSFQMLSQAGAAGRMILRDAGAALLGVDPASCTVADSVVRSGDQALSFADIVRQGDVSRSFSEEELAAMPLKPAGDRTLLGQSFKALDVPEKSRGTAEYGLDAELPGMVYAYPLIPPTRYGSEITSVDDSAARAVSGYQQTLTLADPSGFAQGWAVVIAESFPAAMKAAELVNIEWQAGPTAEIGEADIIAHGEALTADKAAGVLVVDDGDIAAVREEAERSHTASYTTATALHFTLEPQNALVEFRDGQCHIHAGNQWQSLILPVLAKTLEMEEADIIIHQYYLGGGFGRRLFGDQMIPAALAAKELGKPVKLVFARAQDSQFDCVRSASVSRLDAHFDAEGELTGIEHAAAAGWPTLALAPGFMPEGVDGNGKFDPFSISGSDHWYTLPCHRVRAINNDLAQQTFLPGWLRAVGSGWIGWSVESFMDEIAEIQGKDPVEFRLAMLDGAGKNSGSSPNSVGGATRLAAALRDVRDRSGWGRELPAGEGMGVAVSHGQERNMPTWTACVAHVAVDLETQSIRLVKLWQTIDCGTVIHPDGALAQAEGATLWGVSLALHEGTKIEQGQVRDQNLDSYMPLRMKDVPEMDLKFMDSDQFPTGMGEPPLIAVPPAIGNAVYAASGQRIRDLPIKLEA